MPTQPVSRARPNPFADISFRIPATEHDYGKLTATEQQQLADALRALDCARPPNLPGTADRVVCNTTGTIAALTGSPIIIGNDVVSATANPSAVTGSTDWTVDVDLTKPGASAVHRWTSRHHSDSQSASAVQNTAAAPPCGPSQRVACSNFIAFVVGEHAVAIPITLAVLDRMIEISGGFDKNTASQIAHHFSP